jgi:uncharacterized protein involved in exopolysaccharide biosynthesis
MDILVRHKAKLLICSAACLLVAILDVALRHAPPYRSEGRVFVRYAAPAPAMVDLMAEEAEVLRSADFLRRVAGAVGAETILGKTAGGQDVPLATAVLKKGVVVSTVPRSSVIRVAFRHPDRDVVQPVMDEIMNQFLRESHSPRFTQLFPHGFLTIIQSPTAPFVDIADSRRIREMFVMVGSLFGLAWLFLTGWTQVRLKLAH